MDILIRINRIFNKYKFTIGLFITIVVLFLLVMNSIDKMYKDHNNSSENDTTIVAKNTTENDINSNSVSNDNENDSNNTSRYTSKEDSIKNFVNLCNNEKIDEAYNMLSDDCKKFLYQSKEDFIKNYYNNFIQTKKQIKISKYNENTYKVNFIEDALVTGNNNYNENKNVDYITIESGNKLNISGFIKNDKINKNNKNEYVDITITNRLVFYDYEIYLGTATNLTKADIYLNDLVKSNTYLLDNNYNKLSLKTQEYVEETLKIPSSSKSDIKLKFEFTYKNNRKIESINFEDIKIVNKIYYDNSENNNIQNNSQIISHEGKYTNYPERINLKIALI